MASVFGVTRHIDCVGSLDICSAEFWFYVNIPKCVVRDRKIREGNCKGGALSGIRLVMISL